jgi:hypothetical protein
MTLRRSLYARPEILRGAMHRGAAWPAERQSSCPARRQASRALVGGRTAEPSWAAERRRGRPREHGFRRPAGDPLGWWPGCPVPAVPWSPCPVLGQRPLLRCPVSGVSGQVHACDVHATGCPVSSVGVRASGVNVSAFRVRWTDPGSPSPRRVDGSHTGGRLESVVAPRYPRPPCPLPESRAWHSSLAQAVLPRGVGLDLVVVGGLGSGQASSPS